MKRKKHKGIEIKNSKRQKRIKTKERKTTTKTTQHHAAHAHAPIVPRTKAARLHVRQGRAKFVGTMDRLRRHARCRCRRICRMERS